MKLREILATVATLLSPQKRFDVAMDKGTSPETLTKLSDDKHIQVRQAVAANIKTPSGILEKLAKDEDAGVRSNVAQNNNTLPSTLEELAKDSDKKVIWEVADNENTSASVLAELAERDEYYDSITRINIASNKSTRPETLAKLGLIKSANGPTTMVRAAVAANPNTPAFVLTELAQDKNSRVRSAVKGNKSTPWIVTNFMPGEDTQDKAGGQLPYITSSRRSELPRPKDFE